jgi:hypothetical protein
VSAIGDFAVTVYDPVPAPGGTVTPPLTYRVVEEVFAIYLPLVCR